MNTITSTNSILEKIPMSPVVVPVEEKQGITLQQFKRAVGAGIFLNYSRSDELFALELTEKLRETGINIWLDMIDVEDDGDWFAEIDAALESKGLMIAILSPEALEEEQLRDERQQFRQCGKFILPVIHEKCELQGLKFHLPFVDFSSDFGRGFLQLSRILTAATPTA